MKGRHVVILMFVFGLSLLAILFRVLPTAKPPVRPEPGPTTFDPPPPPQPPPPEAKDSGTIEVFVKSKGAPVQGAAVSFQYLRGNRTFQMMSDAEGRCLAARAEPGPWRILARLPGVSGSLANTTVEIDRKVRVDLDLAASVTLEGYVRDPAGNPVPGAKVAMALMDPAFTTRTDSTGHYIIRDLPPGTHSVTASSERLRPQTIPLLDLTAAGQTVQQPFELQFGVSLTGKVIDETGAPVARATVTVSNEVARVVRTDENGDFKAEGLGESPITISVVARGFAPGVLRGVTPGPIPERVTLMRGATLSGRIDGPPAAFTVHLSRFDEELSRMQLVRSRSFGVEAQGVFHVPELPRGRYEAVFETADHRTPAPLAFTLESGQIYDAGLVILARK